MCLITVAGTLALAAPAAAATTSCSSLQEKTFAVPDDYDVEVEVRVCVYKSGNYRHAYIAFSWWSWGIFGKKFDNFDIVVTLEKNDVIHAINTCDLTSRMNNDARDSHTCYGDTVNSSASGGWSGDGWIRYNYDGDGQGNFTWELHGSPLVS